MRVMQRQLSTSFTSWRDVAAVSAALKQMGTAICGRLLQWRLALVFNRWQVCHSRGSVLTIQCLRDNIEVCISSPSCLSGRDGTDIGQESYCRLAACACADCDATPDWQQVLVPTAMLLQGMVMDRAAMRSKLAACIGRLQGNLVSKALHTWKAQHDNEVASWAYFSGSVVHLG